MGLKFIATGIGSMPYSEPERALKIISSATPCMPHWPQLPNRGEQEHFVYQYLAPLLNLGIIVTEEVRPPYIDSDQEAFTDRLTNFYEQYLAAEAGDEQALQAFAFPKDSAKGFYAFCDGISNGDFPSAEFFKGQISGHLSVALNLTDQNKKAVYYDLQLRDVIIKTLAMQAKWQAKTLKSLGKPAVIFIDDPSFYAIGASTHITLNRDEIYNEFQCIVDAIKQEGALAGVHSCANVDWSLFLSSGVDILSFDAYWYFNNLILYSQDVAEFLNKGGQLAWGIVPTSEDDINKENAESLLLKLNSQIEALARKGVSIEDLRTNSLVTPSCGTGTLTADTAEKVYDLLKQISIKLQSA